MSQVVNIDMKKEKPDIKKIIAVMSGKGGVGKSTVTALVATSLKNAGHEVGILDADITGPSIPKLFGLKDVKLFQTDKGLSTAKTVTGIKVISLNLLLENEGEPVIWRGPMLGNMVKQFYEDVDWGQLDYLVVDLPPGTSDVTLTVMDSMTIDGLVVVSTPQDLVHLIVNKSIVMAQKMKTPILGLVENMSYFKCDQCEQKHYLFGKGQGEILFEKYGIKTLGSLPIDKDLTSFGDEGRIELYPNINLDFEEQFSKSFLKAVDEM